MKDARFEDISGPAVIVSLEDNPRTEINMENAVCRRVPVFAAFRESGRKVAAPGEMYEVKMFSHGLQFRRHRRRAGRPATSSRPSPLAAMPAPVEVRSSRSAGARYLGEHPVAGREGRRLHRRYRGLPQSRRRPSRHLFSHREVRDQRHHRAAARYRADRPASQRDADRFCAMARPRSRASARPSR